MGDDLSLLTAGELSPYISDPALKLFQCAVCNKFTSDSLEALSVHVSSERSLPEEEWRAVIGDIYQCKLCNYNTQLKANFQLHCKTDKHMQKYQLVAHIKEGGKSNEWRLKCIAIGNPVHLKCNACDYYSNSVDKLRLHTTNHRHEAALKLYKVSSDIRFRWHRVEKGVNCFRAWSTNLQVRKKEEKKKKETGKVHSCCLTLLNVDGDRWNWRSYLQGSPCVPFRPVSVALMAFLVSRK